MYFQNLNNGFKTSFAVLMIMVLVAALAANVMFPPKPAKAYSTVIQQIIEYIMEIINWYQDYSSQSDQEDSLEEIEDIQDWFKDDTLDRRDERESWNEDRKDMLDELVNDIIDDMKDMGDGDPAFVSDWTGYLSSSANAAYLGFVENGLNQADMVDMFQAETQQELSAGNEPPYLTQIQAPSGYDAEALYNGTSPDFWRDWGYLLSPSGNPFGAYMISSDEKLKTESLAYTAQFGELLANQGFRSTDETPGIIGSYAAQRASMMDLDYLLNSDELETYFGSVADAFINRILDEGLLDMLTDGSYVPTEPPPIYPPVVPPEEMACTYAESNGLYIGQTLDRLNQTIENLNARIAEQDLNLSLLNQIAARQVSCGVSTATTDSQIAAVNAERAADVNSINLANQAISTINVLETAINAVEAACATGDEASVTAPAAALATADATALAAVNTLAGGTSSDIFDALNDVSDFNSEVIRETAQYIAQRGTDQATWQMPQYLYGLLNRLSIFCY